MGDFYSRRSIDRCDPEEPQYLLEKDHEQPVQLLNVSASAIHTSAAYRPDIDGLRGFGALLVIWFHFCETWNDSPYKGADLTNSTFFAVSGFVITLSVLRARARNPLPINASNTAGFAVVFLCRRLQRLVMTQLFVTFITMSIFLATLYPGPRLLGIIRTAQYSVIGGANVYFGTSKEETSYVSATVTDTSLAKNPLMHTWYLDVEEQVYLLYPWIFAAAHLYAARSNKIPYYVFGAVFLASFTCAVNADATASSFFLLQYRGWEVIVGVLICHALMYSKCFGGIKTDDGSLLRNNILHWPQLSSIVLVSASLWLFQYPEYSLICTICALAGTSIFFISGHGYQWNSIYSQSSRKINSRSEVPLLNYFYGLALPAYVGRLSYAMYLWHFPVAVLCADFKEEIQLLIGTTNTIAFSFQLWLVMILSIFTHHMVENPFRWWKPSNQYLPAFYILILGIGMEIWLYGILPQVLEVSQLNIIRSSSDVLPPIFSTAKLAYMVTAVIISALVMTKLLSKTFYCTKSTTLCGMVVVIFPLGLLYYEINLQPQQSLILTSISTTKGNVENLSLGTSVGKNESTFWNWGGGTHSFASFGCACHHIGNARAPPDASRSNTMLPLCYDPVHWNGEPRFAYGEGDKLDKCTIGFGADQIHMRNDVSLTADKIWKLCREPGRLENESTPTAFVVGGSISTRLRVAVANAVGGEFSVLGYGLDSFNEPEHFSLLDTDGAGATNKIHFNIDSARKKTYGEKNENKLRELGKKLQYVERIGQLLDQHLGKGDLLFLTWKPLDPGIKEKKAKIEEQLAGFIRLGEVLHSRGATLVLTTGHLHNGTKESRENGFVEDSKSFLKRQKEYERVLQDASTQSPGSIVHWPLGEQFCGDACSRLIAGTNQSIGNTYQGGYNNAGKYDWWHPSSQAEAFLSPFLCSFLNRRDLLPVVKKPEKYNLQFQHDRQKIDISKLRAGKDQYVFKVYRLPPNLQLSAVTAFNPIYEPMAHTSIIHHVQIYACTEFPKQAKNLEESFSTPDNVAGFYDGVKSVCPHTIWAQGMESPPMQFPMSSKDEQIAVLVDTEYILFEVHYKRPEAYGIIDDDVVSDSSGMSATFIPLEAARRLGTTFKFIQLVLLGPQVPEMLLVPPGRAQEKVSSVCPKECFKDTLERSSITKLSIMGYVPHAHSAATAVYGEVLHQNQERITPIAVTPNYPEWSKHEVATFYSEPVEVTTDDAVKITCVYNTTNRKHVTTLGPTLKDEMCQVHLLISPPLPGFNKCWHLDHNAVTERGGTSCVAECGSGSYPTFSLPRNNTKWPWSNATDRKVLGDAYPSSPVCE